MSVSAGYLLTASLIWKIEIACKRQNCYNNIPLSQLSQILAKQIEYCRGMALLRYVDEGANMMDRRSTVMQALGHIEGGRIPFYADFTQGERLRLQDYYGDANFDRRWNMHLDLALYGWFDPVAGKPEHFRDEFGVVWNRSGADKDIGVVDQPLIVDIANDDYKMPEPQEARFREALDDLVRRKGDKFAIAGLGFSMFERAWSLMTIPETLVHMIDEPEALEALMERICEFNLKVVDIALEYDIDCVHFGDDWGQQRGLIMGAPHWRRFIKPRMKRLYERVKSAGKFISQHSCGDVLEIFPDLIEIGLDIYQTFQPEIYDIEQVKKTYGKDLTFWGGISTQRLLPYASAEEVAKETERIMRVMAKGGGYIAAPTHSVPQDVPPENIHAMMEVFEHQEKYL